MKENRKIFVQYIQIFKNKKIIQTVNIDEVMKLNSGEEIAEILLNDFSGDNYVLTYNNNKKLKKYDYEK